jgi:hypothetical protein
MTLRWVPGWNGLTEPEAVSYVAAVEAADGEPLEFGVAKAINDFVLGCKNDGIWDAIKASCILAGARTLSGALVPLVGTAPTNYNFVSGDYDRETGLVGDLSTKYLLTGWSPTASNLNNMHLAVYASFIDTSPQNQHLIGGASPSELWFNGLAGSTTFVFRANESSGGQNIGTNAAGFYGWSRGDSSNKTIRYPSTSVEQGYASISISTNQVGVFARSVGSSPAGHRLAFFTAGESLDLAALDTRVSALITAIGAAIP